MAVVNLKATQYAPGLISDPLMKAGRPRVITDEVSNAATDSNGSKYLLCELPSDCILLPQAYFDVQGTGFTDIRIGTFGAGIGSGVTALVNQLKSAANIVSPIAAGDANHNRRLWQVLGFAADPRGFIGLYQHAVAGATGAGTLQFQVWYLAN